MLWPSRNRSKRKTAADKDFEDAEKFMGRSQLPAEIIELILSNVGVKQLKECRLVCKSWNVESCRLLKGKLSIRLRAKDIANFCWHKKSAQSQGFPSAHLLYEPEVTVKLVVPEGEAPAAKEAIAQHAQSFPTVTKLILINPLEEHSKSRTADCGWIVNRYAAALTHFTISSNENFDFIIGCLPTSDFPRLEYLEVDAGLCSPYHTMDYYMYYEQFMVLNTIRKILCTSPNLHTFKSDGGGEFIIPEIMLRPFHFHGLLHLEIVPQSMIFQKVLDCRPILPLRTLVLHCRLDVDLDICDILAQFAFTLQRLEIRYGPSFPEEYNYEDIPFFPVLKDLAVSCDFRLGDAWLRKMPQLRKLRVEKFDLSCMPGREIVGPLKLLELRACPKRNDPPPLEPEEYDFCEDYDYYHHHPDSFPSVEKISGQVIKLAKQHQRAEVMAEFQRIFPNVKCWKPEGYGKPLVDFVSSLEGQQSLGCVIEKAPKDEQFCHACDLNSDFLCFMFHSLLVKDILCFFKFILILMLTLTFLDWGWQNEVWVLIRDLCVKYFWVVYHLIV